ncbi:hypothetical protein GW793_03840 [bacterium]|uniref:Uncharacterized protein n=2 Tax=Katanobacteria TaxID=422282 RepID=A0A2M7X1G6_UNCKA|nr:hypothetical protein [bacterium]PIP56033.1 MAG: hypothetical protein COX05_05135 [candidate division WWE3 bacterium CG22_combo_CG10-13_8_21_14_all_39_12]PJA40013.1 MAG: hypothetical protein CO179_03660 [candidate division WWE3 bacterium CG_4_9_14_3_um_filter_39_7]
MLINQKKIDLIKKLLAQGIIELSPDKSKFRSIQLWKLLQYPRLLTEVSQAIACRLYALDYDYLAASSCSTLPALVSTSIAMVRPSVFVPTGWTFLLAHLNSMRQYKPGETLVLIEPLANPVSLSKRVATIRSTLAVVTDVVALFEQPPFEYVALTSMGIHLQSVFLWDDVQLACS